MAESNVTTLQKKVKAEPPGEAPTTDQAWQDGAFVKRVQGFLDGSEKPANDAQGKLIEKIRGSIKTAQDIREAARKAAEQIEQAKLQAERAEGHTQAFLSILREELQTTDGK